MSIQWTFIAGYLYFEVAIVSIMMLPIVSPRRWNRFFKSRLFSLFREHAAVYFYVLLGVLCLFLTDAIREMRKYAHSTDSSHGHLSSEMKGNVKLFRAQRNFYITGFAIFLAFVIRRLVTMLIIQAELLDKSEKIIKEAENVKNLAKDAINAHTLQSAGDAQTQNDIKQRLEETQLLLEQEKSKVKQLEIEMAKWKAQCNEIRAEE